MHNNVIINEEILNKVSQSFYDKMVSVASVSEISKNRKDDDILKILEEEGF